MGVRLPGKRAPASNLQQDGRIRLCAPEAAFRFAFLGRRRLRLFPALDAVTPGGFRHRSTMPGGDPMHVLAFVSWHG